ncbi:hypothetical protein INT43_007587 [Umbelopsis isabellina]|uniref:Uncharacterized protein n=1 Tax=Mortierella isabellina TaxID=91625 RepID=A0A8H7UEG8_MORIS|nr:hypothetical protein INT43_007587 [Umbelopsis isabellina]
MSTETELTDYQQNKELLNRLVSIHETPFKLPQRFWNIREQETDSVPLDVVERAITDLNLGIKSRTQKAFSPLMIRKFVESMEHERLQKAHPKPTNHASIPSFDPRDPLSWVASTPAELDVGTTKDMTSARRIDVTSLQHIDQDSELFQEIQRTSQLTHKLITNLERLPITNMPRNDQTKQIKSIDNITKDMLWQ